MPSPFILLGLWFVALAFGAWLEARENRESTVSPLDDRYDRSYIANDASEVQAFRARTGWPWWVVHYWKRQNRHSGVGQAVMRPTRGWALRAAARHLHRQEKWL